MTDNSQVKTKRVCTKFKNPPQPHMCIRDSLQESEVTCYINVLSWDKVGLGESLENVPIYGGIQVTPPRSEKEAVIVFAVLVNPEILKVHGKKSVNNMVNTA